VSADVRAAADDGSAAAPRRCEAIVPQTLGRRSWRAGHCTGDRQRNGGTEDSVGVLALLGFDQPLRDGAVAFRDALRIVVGAWRVARANSRCRGGGARGVIEQT
jgi:hypothetical protein